MEHRQQNGRLERLQRDVVPTHGKATNSHLHTITARPITATLPPTDSDDESSDPDYYPRSIMNRRSEHQKRSKQRVSPLYPQVDHPNSLQHNQEQIGMANTKRKRKDDDLTNTATDKFTKGTWTTDEDISLVFAYDEFKHSRKKYKPSWIKIAERMGTHRQPKACFHRYHEVLFPRLLAALDPTLIINRPIEAVATEVSQFVRLNRSEVEKALESKAAAAAANWTAAEDDMLKSYIESNPNPDWKKASEFIPGRSAKSCYHR